MHSVRIDALGCLILVLLLLLSALSISDSEPNDNMQEAEEIVLGSEISGTLDSSSDDYDYYNITLNASVDVIAILDGPENADFDLSIFNHNGTKLAGTTDDWDADESIIFLPEETGYYFIGIWAYDGNGSYTLKVDTPKTTSNDTYTLSDAIEYGYIEAEITGVYDGTEEVFDLKNGKEVFYGQCVKISLTSFVANDLNIVVPCGLKLISSDEEVEDKVITKTHTIKVNSLVANETDIFAMSINMYKNIPILHSTFEMGEMASGDMKKIADHINEHNHQTSAGQAAVWMISDDATSTELEQIGATSSIITAAELMLIEAGITTSENGEEEPDDESTTITDWIAPIIIIIIVVLIIIGLIIRRPKAKQPSFDDMEAVSPSEPAKSSSSELPPPRRQPPTPPPPPPP